MSMIRL